MFKYASLRWPFNVTVNLEVPLTVFQLTYKKLFKTEEINNLEVREKGKN